MAQENSMSDLEGSYKVEQKALPESRLKVSG